MSAQRERSRSRRLLWGAALALAVGAIGWQVAKRAIDVEQQRPLIEAAIEEFTGLPVTIRALELAWHPVPCLSAHDVSIGEGDFHAATARLDVFPRIAGLLRGRLEIARINMVKPAITLPPSRDQVTSQWRSLIEHIEVAQARRALDAEPGSRPSEVHIDELLAEQAVLHLGLDDARSIVGSITATGIGGDEIAVSIDLQVANTSARAEGTLRLPGREGAEVGGDLTLSGVRLSEFADVPEFADTEWEARAGLSGTFAQDLALAVEGSFKPVASGSLAGKFSGQARIAPDGKTRADLAIDGDGLDVRATARLFAGDRSRVRIKSAEAGGAALAALLKAVSGDPVKLRGARHASIEVRDLGVSIAPTPRLTSGEISAQGIRLSWRGAPIAPELRLAARAEEGAIRIDELRGGPIDLRGVVTPQDTPGRVTLDLSGTIAVDEALLHALGAPAVIRAANGSLAIEALRAEFSEASSRYSVNARLAGGSMQLDSDAYSETFSGIDLRLAGNQDALRFDGRGIAAALGPIAADAEFDLAMSRAQGSLTLEDARADFLRDPGARARFSPLVNAYSGVPVAWEIQRDAEPPHVHRIRFERAPSPRVNAVLVLRSEPHEDPIRDLDVSADLPAEALVGFLPEAARTSGVGSLRVRRSGGGAGFFAEADLGGLGIATGEFLDKKPGEKLTVRVEGIAGEQWHAQKLILAAEQGKIEAAIDDDGISADDLDIDLAAFSFLLIDGARASGRLRASFETATDSANLRLVNVAVWLTPELNVDRADGEIALTGHDWGVRDLRVQGRESDATLDIAVQSDQLRGRVIGARIDADFARKFFEQLDALEFRKHEPTGPGTSGDLAIAVDQVSYGRATIERCTAAVQFDHDDIHVRNLAFAVGEGRVSGRVDVDRREPEPPLIDLELEFANLPRRFLDDLNESPEENGGTGGTWDGKLRFTAPLHAHLKAMLPDASGSLTANGRDGVLVGRLGLTTKIVTVLRSTEALRMRFPTLRDEGIVFDTVRGDIVMKDGRAEIRGIDLESTSYAMSATGELNFRDGTSRVPIEVNAIRGIVSFVERVPVAGDALKIVNVRLVATGSPYDMQVRVASIQDQLIGAGMAGPKAVIKGVGDAMKLMRRARGRGGANPELEPSPEPAPAPSAAEPPSPDAPSAATPAPAQLPE